jgi:hypothetical protein
MVNINAMMHVLERDMTITRTRNNKFSAAIKADKFLFTTATRLILWAQKSLIIQWLNGEMFIRGEA